MTPQILTAECDYNNAPVGTIAVDPEGWAWQKIATTTYADGTQDCEWRATKEDSLGDAFEGNSLFVEARGPHIVIHTPAQTDPVVTPNYEYSTPAELYLLDLLPDGYTVQDNDGRTWERTGGFWQSGLTGADNLSRKHTPYTITKAPETPEPTEEPKRVYVTEADVEELNNAPIGTFVADKEVDSWVKTHDGWTSVAEFRAPLHVRYAPYTLIHTPPSDPANL